MVLVHKDRAGNKLYLAGTKIYVKNRKGKFVNQRGVVTMLRRANKAGKIRFRG